MKKDEESSKLRRSSFINTVKPRNFKERRRLAMSAEIDPDDLEVKLKEYQNENNALSQKVDEI